MRYKITSYELLEQMIASTPYDPTVHWSSYPCLIWPRGKGGHGYGTVRTPDGKTRGAHRVAYEFVHGELPSGIEACHHCDVESCIHVAHLFAGSHLDNMRDMYAKGRRKAVNGEQHHAARFTPDQIPVIRKLYAEGVSQRDLAAQFGVVKNSIAQVLHGQTWKHLIPEENMEAVLSQRKDRKATGEDSGSSRLTESQVLEIRGRRLLGETTRHIAEAFGVTHTTVRMILLGRTWKRI